MLSTLFPRCRVFLRSCRYLPPRGSIPHRAASTAVGRPAPLKVPARKDAVTPKGANPRAVEGPRLADYDLDDVRQWQPATPKCALPAKLNPPTSTPPERPPPGAEGGGPVAQGDRGLLQQMEEEAAAAPLDPGVPGEEAPASVPQAWDRLLLRIHKARDFEGMLRVVERDAGALAGHHLLAVVNGIVDQLRANRAVDEQLRDAMHADGRFRLLLTQLVRRHGQLSADDVVPVLKMLQHARVPDTSRVHLFFLQRLRDGLQELSFGALLFAGQMLLRYPATGNTLVNGLRAAIPGAFEGRLAGELDTGSIEDMSRALSVLANYRGHIRQPACQPLYDALDRWVGHHESDPALPTLLPPQQAADLLIRMERAAYLSHPVVDMVLKLLGQSHAGSVGPETMRRLFKSVRHLLRKFPAEFPPAHRIHALETEMTASLPDATTGR